MAAAQQSRLLSRLTGVLGFFIGIFGAMAILGVFFKILKLPNFELFMKIGFIGEAAAFVVMGVFALINAFARRDEDQEAPAVPAPTADGFDARAAARAQAEVREAVQQALEQRVTADVERMMATLSEEVGRFGTEIQHVGGELERARQAIYTMRQELDRVASGDLAGDAERLGRGMQVLGTEMTEAGGAVERLRSDLDEMAQRFRFFNDPHPRGEPTPQSKIKKMPWS